MTSAAPHAQTPPAPPAVTDAVIVGATGYVGGELLRLLAGHPFLRVHAACARRADVALGDEFPHLAAAYPDLTTTALDALPDALTGDGPLALFFALPHAASAAAIDATLSSIERPCAVVDLSADFRLGTPEAFEAVYGMPHPAPARCAEFHCGLPDLERGPAPALIAEPGCFTTATTLGTAPLVAHDLVEPRIVVNAITGSTGSGNRPSATTHHPERHSSVKQYNPLRHRHRPEMEMLLARLGPTAPEIVFTPHSGPFARGIFATINARLRHPITEAELVELYRTFYTDTPFVDVVAGSVSLKHVVGTNRCRIGVTTDGTDVVVGSAIDNLIKGAAGGAVQWMNRRLGFPETAGLDAPALGWT